MNSLVIMSEKGTPVTNSLLVAEKFGKRHVEVLDAIRELLTKAENSTFVNNKLIINMFFLTKQNIPMPVGGGFKETPMYVMTRDGFSLLVMGFTGEKALNFKFEFLEAFNKMESMLKSDDYILSRSQEILNNRIKLLQQYVNQKDAQLEEQKPKVLFAECVTASDDSILIAELAKILKQNGVDMGQNRLFEWMRKNGYLCSKGSYYNQPTQKAMELGLFEIKETSIAHSDGSVSIGITTKVTGKGQVYFVNKFLRKQVA